MIEAWDIMTLDERRDALWGLRDGSANHINRVRLDGFEALKHLILERDLPKSVTHPPEPVKVVRINLDPARHFPLRQIDPPATWMG